jgi:hypothetical protein
MYFNITLAIYDKPTAKNHTKWGKTETISSKVMNEIRVSILSTLTQRTSRIPCQSNKTGRKNKMNSNRKEEVKLSLFADDMILYLKDPENSTKKLIDIINTFRTVAGYKNNLQKSVAFLNTKTNRLRKNTGKQFHLQ